MNIRVGVNGTLSYPGGEVRLITLNEDKVLLNVSGEEKTPPLGINTPKNIGDSVLYCKKHILFRKQKATVLQ